MNLHVYSSLTIQYRRSSYDLQYQENTREQPDHRSTTRENHSTGLPHALLRAKTLTSFARPPHDLLHTFPRQVASAAPPCERSAATTVAPSQCMRKIHVDHFSSSDGCKYLYDLRHPSLEEIRHSRKSTEK